MYKTRAGLHYPWFFNIEFLILKHSEARGKTSWWCNLEDVFVCYSIVSWRLCGMSWTQKKRGLWAAYDGKWYCLPRSARPSGTVNNTGLRRDQRRSPSAIENISPWYVSQSDRSELLRFYILFSITTQLRTLFNPWRTVDFDLRTSCSCWVKEDDAFIKTFS